jgi:PAS domain S-box-containing protein
MSGAAGAGYGRASFMSNSLEPSSGHGRRVALRGDEGSPPDRCLRTLWACSYDALAVVDDQRRYRHVNPAAEELFASSARSILAKRIDDFTPPAWLEPLKKLWWRLERSGHVDGPYVMLRADGVTRQIEFRAMREYGERDYVIVAREVTAARPGPAVGSRPLLTARELEVLQLAAEGGSTRTIAEALFISPTTVKTHFEHLYEKLGVRDRGAAVAEGLRNGLIV